MKLIRCLMVLATMMGVFAQTPVRIPDFRAAARSPADADKGGPGDLWVDWVQMPPVIYVKTNGTAQTGWTTYPSANGGNPSFDTITAPIGSGASYLVATTTSTAKDIARADYVCDGSNDQEQIQAALTAIASAGGGTLRVASGAYSVTTNMLYGSYTRIVGDGNSTIFKAGTNFNGSIFKSNGRVHDCIFENFQIDGNASNQSSSGTGMEFDGYYSVWRNVWIINCKTYGMNGTSTVDSGSNMIYGGRFAVATAGTSAIYLTASFEDFIISGSVFTGGADTVNIRGGSGKLADCIFFTSTSSNLRIGAANTIENCRFGDVGRAIWIDGATNNVIGLWSGTQIINPLFSLVTTNCVYQNSGSTFSAYLTIEGWVGGSTDKELSLDGSGTHRLKIKSGFQDLDCELVGGGTIHSESFVKQPDRRQTTAPSNPVLGMIYLDSGANTASGSMGYRRYSGSTWEDIGSAVISGTWSAVSALTPAAGTIGYVSNLGAGANVSYVGSRWKPVNGRAVLTTLGATVSGITNVTNQVMQATIPAGAWKVNDVLRIYGAYTKSAAVADSCNVTVSIGTAGTVSDALVVPTTAFLGTTGRSWNGFTDIKLISNTFAKKMAGSAGASTGAGSSTGSSPASVGISDASANALLVTVYVGSSGSTETVGMESGSIELLTP